MAVQGIAVTNARSMRAWNGRSRGGECLVLQCAAGRTHRRLVGSFAR